mmetsp:Transcript_48599/g.135812  ORF Transcript_48599/g.135812 Transcript_48599/m.135812 type:complete len:253 (-) Transcript_48599:195-953(-)|eukprot:CAMPEP_0117576218 /NCGR_PEP_ID=MMETSP0784-20121206/62672_1 /TAXON_ID=39447 /ORGANISM="" /LENGTH=252 /DNA_ID=CAMNT_0005375439 /DNA_START=93 /DNA_END=851 /DNA_ORIENTATION=-
MGIPGVVGVGAAVTFAEVGLLVYDIIEAGNSKSIPEPNSSFDTNFFHAVPEGTDSSDFIRWQQGIYLYSDTWENDDGGINWGGCFLEIITLSLADTDKGCSSEPTFGATANVHIVGHYNGQLTDAAAKKINATEPAKAGKYLSSVGLLPTYVHVGKGVSLDCYVMALDPIDVRQNATDPVMSKLSVQMHCQFKGKKGSFTRTARQFDFFANGRLEKSEGYIPTEEVSGATESPPILGVFIAVIILSGVILTV